MLKKTFLFTALLSLVFLSACSVKKEETLSPETARLKAEQFLNDNFMDPDNPIAISEVEDDEQSGLYKLKVELGAGESVDSYISKDGKNFYPQAYSISEIKEEMKAAEAASATNTDSYNYNEGADIESESRAVVYFFWGDGCSHCAAQKAAMATWSEQFPGIDIKTYETWGNEDHREMLEELAEAYGTSVQGVPMTFIGDKYWIGYSDSMKAEMEAQISECLKNTCKNPGLKLK